MSEQIKLKQILPIIESSIKVSDKNSRSITQLEFLYEYFPGLIVQASDRDEYDSRAFCIKFSRFKDGRPQIPSSAGTEKNHLDTLIGGLFGKDSGKYRYISDVVDIQKNAANKLGILSDPALGKIRLHVEKVFNSFSYDQKEKFYKEIFEYMKKLRSDIKCANHQSGTEPAELEIPKNEYEQLILEYLIKQWDSTTSDDFGKKNAFTWLLLGALLRKQVCKLMNVYDPDFSMKLVPSITNVGDIPISSSVKFIRSAINKLEEVGETIKTVCMVFQSGKDWFNNDEKIDLLVNTLINEKNVDLQILVNSSDDAVDSITESMRNPDKDYLGFNYWVQKWKARSEKYRGKMEVRVSPLPLLRRMYLIKGNMNGLMNVKYYTYNNTNQDKNFSCNFRSGTTEYDLYDKEYKYLWENAVQVVNKIPIHAIPFFGAAFKMMDSIQDVCMAFHAGRHWLDNKEYGDVLKQIIEKADAVRVLVNTTEVVGTITENMKDPNVWYRSCEDCLSYWQEMSNKYSNLSVRIAYLPLLHQMYILNGKTKDKETGLAHIRYYTYANTDSKKDARCVFKLGTSEFEVYQAEFEYLWNYQPEN